jgi:hypothetical protein
MSRPGNCFVSVDLTNWYYTLGILEEDRDYFAVNCRGTMWRLAWLPMGWSGSAYYFCKLAYLFIDYLRRPLPPTPTTAPTSGRPSKRLLRNARWRGTRLLPYIDDFMFLADTDNTALLRRQRVDFLLDNPELLHNPKKGI